MAKSKNSVVTIQVDKNWFENVFEKQRKKLEKNFGMRISQRKVTVLDVNMRKLLNGKKSNGKRKI